MPSNLYEVSSNPHEVSPSDPWKEAVIEQIMLTEGAPPNLDDPVAAIKYLIDYHVRMELDLCNEIIERGSYDL